MTSQQTVLIIGFVWPEPDSSAAGSRMMQLISSFLDQDWHVTFASTASESAYMADIRALGINQKCITLNSSDFDAYIADLNPSIVLFDRFMIEEQFGWRVAAQCPNALRILDLEDLHFLRRARQKAFKTHCEFSLDNLLDSDDAKREVASIFRCDLTLVISEYEMDVLRDVFNVDASLFHYLPIMTDQIHENESLPVFEERNDFVFIGNFLHEPNLDAAKYLKQVLWPKIHSELPDATLQIYGAYTPESLLQLHNPKEKFLVNGRAQDAKAVVKKAKVVLAPLRFGAGIKGKFLEAMQCGTPSITTTVGSEAMHGDLPWCGFVSDDPQEMADATIKIYNDKLLWLQAQQNGFAIINNRFSKSLFEEDFINRILSVQLDLTHHRKNNFIGAMLQFHTMRSTEYLSRWIEEKNKKS